MSGLSLAVQVFMDDSATVGELSWQVGWQLQLVVRLLVARLRRADTAAYAVQLHAPCE